MRGLRIMIENYRSRNINISIIRYNLQLFKKLPMI